MFWLWLGLGIVLSVPLLLALALTYLYFYLVNRHMGFMLRVFQETPLFIIPRGQPTSRWM